MVKESTSTIADFIGTKIAEAPQISRAVFTYGIANEPIIKAYEVARNLYYAEGAKCTGFEAIIAGLTSQGLSWRQEVGQKEDGSTIFNYRRVLQMFDILKERPMMYERRLAIVK